MPANQTRFTIIYDGEALRDSRMDVRDLAPALLAFGNLLEQANRVVNGDKATVTISVKAFQAGCFGVSFELMQSYAEVIRGFFAPGAGVRDTLEILSLLGLAPATLIGGLVWVVRTLKGKRPKHVTALENGNVSLEYEGENGELENVETSPEVLELYKDAKVRAALDEGMEPLRKEGIDSFAVEDNSGQRILLVSSREADYFTMPSLEPALPLLDNHPQERILSIVSLSFKEENKWRLSDGSAVFNVKIRDAAFLKRVNDGAAFAKGDMLRIMLVTSVSYTKDGLKTEYEATRVLEHIQVPRQLWME